MRLATMLWRVALAGLLVTLAICVWRVTRTLEELPVMLDTRLAQEAESTREAAREEIIATRAALLEEIRALRRDARAELARAVTLADDRLASIERTAQAELTATRADARLELGLLRGEIQTGREAVERSLGHINALLADGERAIELLTPQALGLTAAAKVTAGQTAQTMRTIEKAAPAIVENIKATSGNVAEATKPSRWYIRFAEVLVSVLGGWLIGQM